MTGRDGWWASRLAGRLMWMLQALLVPLRAAVLALEAVALAAALALAAAAAGIWSGAVPASRVEAAVAGLGARALEALRSQGIY